VSNIDHIRSAGDTSLQRNAQNGSRYGDPTRLARDLRGKHAELQVLLGQSHAVCRHRDCYSEAHHLPTCLVHPQRLSNDLESVWRMFVMRESAAKRAVWKGWVMYFCTASLLLCCRPCLRGFMTVALVDCPPSTWCACGTCCAARWSRWWRK
jgi:hypothetical protein